MCIRRLVHRPSGLMSAPKTSDQAQKTAPEPFEDPTGHGSLEQLAKKGVGGAQVLAEKLTGSDADRYSSSSTSACIWSHTLTSSTSLQV